MHFKTEAITPDEWADFKNAVHRAIGEIQAEIKDPEHPREEKFRGEGIPFSEADLTPEQKRIAELEKQVATLQKAAAAD